MYFSIPCTTRTENPAVSEASSKPEKMMEGRGSNLAACMHAFFFCLTLRERGITFLVVWRVV